MNAIKRLENSEQSSLLSLQDGDAFRPLIRHKYQVKNSYDSDEENENDSSAEIDGFQLDSFDDSSSHRFVTRKPDLDESESVYGKSKHFLRQQNY